MLTKPSFKKGDFMQQYRENKIAEVRPGSTFDTFKVYDPAQQQVVDLLGNVADQVIARTPRILEEEFPFDNGKILFLWSEPGRGKTHLVEAFINRIRAADKRLAKKMVLSRGRFYFDFQLDINPYGDASIVIVDDMFHDKMSIGDLHPATEVQAFMRFISMVYDRRVLALVTSNFPMIEGGGILSRVAQVDKIGRILSRSKEVLSGSGEIHLAGRDYREVLSDERKTERFTL
jgi:predicted ATPase